ncbi:uncharacterized protein PFL1_00836 [Pseudozyma flocculosa PF-1]|uniref:Carboxypeptidase n=1 Tax=Pseudozyma flocculosa TaxID=84751 RepID=A0A5C3F659_9BASI|nr:uncharacterized protein PFL1_00836 [Pseudozyma flocculosa PF-1]EPQ31503.1 hypothetical protein PFL1_00836 [Pseudozyma flocculosa PF-1]SPO38711.1 probable carboxypeptidase 2 [Pseudozyma flocculosa]
MFPSKLLVALFALASSPAISQFVPRPTDLTRKVGHAGVPVRYKQVETGVCEQNPGVKSFSGYADVQDNEHIFFWFFEARNGDPKEAPLTVWINGGPGSSSMIGLFQELGPCGVDINGEVVDNPYSWSNASNLLFIDQPTTTGFSYGEPVPAYVNPNSSSIVVLPDESCPDYAQAYGTCGTYSRPVTTLTANSTQSAAPNFWRTLQGFMGAFPEYSRKGFNLATESYGGHYGPTFGAYIEEQNAKKIKGAIDIKLETVLIGNGWFDPLLQYQAYYNFTVSPGNTYDYKPYSPSQEAELHNALYGPGNCVDQVKECYAHGLDEVCKAADDFCAANIESPLDNIANRDEYDIRELSPDPFPYSFYVDYLNTPRVQAAIGAFQNFSESSPTVGAAFGATGDDSRQSGTIKNVRRLLQSGVNVVLYAGDADYNCNWLGVEAVAEGVNHDGFSDAGYADLKTSDGIVHGQVKQSGQFSFVRVYESGHEVPFYQPLAALELFERAIGGKDLATGVERIGEGSKYRTKGPAKSLYRNGNSTVQFEPLDPGSTYNTTTNGPNAHPAKGSGEAKSGTSTAKVQRFGFRRPASRRMRA